MVLLLQIVVWMVTELCDRVLRRWMHLKTTIIMTTTNVSTTVLAALPFSNSRSSSSSRQHQLQQALLLEKKNSNSNRQQQHRHRRRRKRRKRIGYKYGRAVQEYHIRSSLRYYSHSLEIILEYNQRGRSCYCCCG